MQPAITDDATREAMPSAITRMLTDVGAGQGGAGKTLQREAGPHKFQSIQGTPQPGSMSAENGIFATTLDQSGSRLLTAECDKTIKIYREDPNATPDSHPLNWKA